MQQLYSIIGYVDSKHFIKYSLDLNLAKKYVKRVIQETPNLNYKIHRYEYHKKIIWENGDTFIHITNEELLNNITIN